MESKNWTTGRVMSRSKVKFSPNRNARIETGRRKLPSSARTLNILVGKIRSRTSVTPGRE